MVQLGVLSVANISNEYSDLTIPQLDELSLEIEKVKEELHTYDFDLYNHKKIMNRNIWKNRKYKTKKKRRYY